MSKKSAQGSLEYIIIIGGIIILAAATYFMLRGFAQTTGAGTTDQIGVAGEKLRLELENLGRSETRFLAQKWGSQPQLSSLTLNNTGNSTTTEVTIYNLTGYGIDLDAVQFAYNDSGTLIFLEHTIEDSTVTITASLPPGITEILVFHNNSSALELDNLNYTSSDLDVTIIDGTPPEESPDVTPPSIIIFTTAYGSAGSVKDADIQVIVYDEDSTIAGIYYSIDNSPYFLADNLYYGYEGMTLEAHPEDNSYNSNTETIHIIATVPAQDNYTVRVKAMDEYANEHVETRQVNIIIGTPPTDTNPPVLSNPEPANNSLITLSLLAINLTTDEEAACRYATSPDMPFSDMYFFTTSGSTFHQLEDIPLSDGVNYKYFFKCKDFPGNTNPTDYLLNFTKSGTDSTPPAIIDSEPGNNSLVAVSLLTINLTTNENAECRFANASGLTYGTMTDMNRTGYTFHQLNLTPEHGQNYKYYFRCNDSNGNVNETAYVLNFTKSEIDTTPPSIADIVFDAPLPFQEGFLNFTATVSDANGVAWCNLSINNSASVLVNTLMSIISGTAYASTGTFSDELYTALINCSDTLGNDNSDSIDFEVDTLDTFSDGSTSVNVTLSSSNSDHKIELPLDAAVINTSMELTGFGKPHDFSFNDNRTYETGDYPYDIYAGDFDKDGNLDTVVVNAVSDSFSYFAGNGNGTFQGKVDYAAGDYPTGIYAGDFNNDSSLDVVTSNSNSDTFSYLAGNGDGTFNTRVSYATGDEPRNIFAGDFNNDGDLDVITANDDSDTFSYFEGNGDGTFQSKADYATGDSPRGIYAADFNNDNNLDVVVTNQNEDTFSYIAGNGDGTFQGPVNYATGELPRRIFAADFDNDSNMDVIVSNVMFWTFSYFPGNGDGTFNTSVNYWADDTLQDLYAGDFNNDGNQDVITANKFTFSYLAGNGDGTFNGSVNYSTRGSREGIYAGDFDKDGDLDVVVINMNLDTFSYFPNNGDGTFQDKSDYKVEDGPWGLFTGDFDNNGYLDVVVSNGPSDTFSYFAGNGDDTFQDKIDYATGSGPYGIFAGDFNHDGNLDVVTSNYHDDNFSYFAGNGDGTFQGALNYTTGDGPSRMHAADFNNDGNLDVVVNNGLSYTFSYLAGNGDGTFNTSVEFATGTAPYDIYAGDFDQDGNLDVVVSNEYSGNFSYFPGNGDGTFNASVNYTVVNYPTGINAGDFNKDGDLDVVVASRQMGDGKISYFEGNGDSTFQSAVTYAVIHEPVLMFAGDFNNNGKLDLVVTNFKSASFSYLAGNGDGTFQSRLDYATGEEPHNIYGRDFDNDGDLDVIVANSGLGTFSYFESNADAIHTFEGFEDKVDYGTGLAPYSIYAGDFNNDGDIDMVVANRNSDNVSYLAGNGDGTFQPKVDYMAGDTPWEIYAADFDNDGDLDVVVANSLSNTFSYLANNGDGTFQDKVDYATDWRPCDINAGDFDHDGDLDVVIPNQQASFSNFSYYENNGDGTFQNMVGYSVGYEPDGIHVGDFDHDGHLDVVVVGSNLSYFAGNGDGTFQPKVDSLSWGEKQGTFAGDFNNDGNLDIVANNYNSDNFSYYENNGDGTFQSGVNYVTADEPYGVYADDFDNDGDVDPVVARWGWNAIAYFENRYTRMADHCSNPSLDIGLDASNEWSYSGDFSTSDVLSGVGFATELNSFLPACTCPGCTTSGGGANCTIALGFSSDTHGIIQLSVLALQNAKPE